MNRPSRPSTRARTRASRHFLLESLEARAVPAIFVAPNLNPYIHAALQGANTAPQGINTMLTALEEQLTDGPLADLQDGTFTVEEFNDDAVELIETYIESVDEILLPRFPNVARILRAEGTAVLAGLESATAQLDVDLIDDAGFEEAAAQIIAAPLNGPLRPLHTPLSGYASRTEAFQDQLAILDESLADDAEFPLNIEEVNDLLQVEAAYYQADLVGPLNGHPWIQSQANAAITALLADVQSIADDPPMDVQAAFADAVSTFDQTILDTTGLFGPRGPIARSLRRS